MLGSHCPLLIIYWIYRTQAVILHRVVKLGWILGSILKIFCRWFLHPVLLSSGKILGLTWRRLYWWNAWLLLLLLRRLRWWLWYILLRLVKALNCIQVNVTIHFLSFFNVLLNYLLLDLLLLLLFNGRHVPHAHGHGFIHSFVLDPH